MSRSNLIGESSRACADQVDAGWRKQHAAKQRARAWSRSNLIGESSNIGRIAQRFRRDASGAAIVEFSITLPLLAVLLLGSIEIASYFWARSRMTDAVTAVGDLTTQTMSVSDSSVSAIFTAARAIISENPLTRDTVSNATVRLTSVLACKCGLEPKAGQTTGKARKNFCYTTLWSHKYKTQKGALSKGYKRGNKLNFVPKELAIDNNDTVIIAEVTYKYKPKIHLVLSSAAISAKERFYFRPRFTDRVTHVGSQAPSTEPHCRREK